MIWSVMHGKTLLGIVNQNTRDAAIREARHVFGWAIDPKTGLGVPRTVTVRPGETQ